MPRTTRPLLTLAALASILVFAIGVRVYGINWDQGHHLHPDERFLAIVTGTIRLPSDVFSYFDTARSTLNPYNNGFDGFAYGTAPLFLVKLIGEWFGKATYEGTPLIGRVASTTADVGTVVLAFLIGQMVFRSSVGLVAALISAATVLHIQLSHFYAVDTFLTFSTTLALYFAYRAWLRGGLLSFALLGFACGLALACKLSAALLAPIVLLAALVPPPGDSPRRTLTDMFGALALCGLVSLLVYRIGEPYSFLGPSIVGIFPNTQRFVDLDRWVKISSGEIEVPFMIQWANTPNPRFALQSIVQWGLGPAAGMAALAGLVVAGAELWRWEKHSRNLLLVAWAVINLGYFSFQYAKFMRYLLPVYPALALLAAYFLVVALPHYAQRAWRPLRMAAAGAAPVVLALTVLYAIAFLAIYDRPNTRVQASEWIYQNIPQGTALGLEHWDDGLPLGLPGYDRKYTDVPMTLYDDESPEMVRKLGEAIDKADYLILSSNRLYGSIPRLPLRYPVAIEYYKALFDGRLGFDLVARFDSNPEILGFAIDTTIAQEDFTVYDHPTVMIFKKSPRYQRAEVATLLGSVPLDQIERVKPVEAGQRKGLMLSPGEQSRVLASGTWADNFSLDGLTTQFAIPIWLLALELVGLAAFPLCWRLFPGLADRGYGASRVIGLVLISYGAWLAASIGLAPFGRGLVYAMFLLLAVAGGAVAWRLRESLVADLRAIWRRLALVEAVFLVALAVMLAIRSLNPDLWHPSFGGEKPMDFAYLNAVVKTPSFPPYDPWFAGGYLNYYYYGFVLASVLIHLTAIPPFVAYNLIVATFFALAVSAAFAVAVSIVAGPEGRRGVGRKAIVAGVVSALLLGVLGNLDGAVQLIEGLGRIGGDGIASGLPVITGLTRVVSGLFGVVMGARPPAFDFWRSTRFIGPEEPGPIHEFPFFTFLYGDPHAHMFALPLQVVSVLIGLQAVRLARSEIQAFAQFRNRKAWRETLALVWRPLALIALAGLLLGTLRATHTWDLPSYLGLFGLFALIAARPGRWVGWVPAAVGTGVTLVAIFAMASALFWPYLSHFELFYSGVVPVKTPTNPTQFVLINGALLLVVSAYLAYCLGRVNDIGQVWGSPSEGNRAPMRAPEAAYLSAIAPTVIIGPDGRISTAAATILGVGVLLWIGGYGTLGLLVALGGLVAAVAVARRSSREMLFVLALSAASLGAMALPEVVAVKGDVGRMNTVFRFYYEAWTMLSILAGPCVVLLTVALFRPISPPARPIWRWAWIATIALLALGTVIYPILATRTKVGLRFEPLAPTLDGMAYMAQARYEDKGRDLDLPSDYRAIRWMMENVQGSPTILEGATPLYHWGSRFSIYTGLPTVLGWDWHQKQQRMAYSSKVEERQRDIQRAYEVADPEAAWSVIRKYDVRFIVVGGLEQAYYPAAGLAKFDSMVGQGLEIAYQDGNVTIYRVTRP